MNFDNLTTEELLFACKHGLPLDAMYYTTEERVRLSEKVIEEETRKKSKQKRRKREVLFDDKNERGSNISLVNKSSIFTGLYFDISDENIILTFIFVHKLSKDNPLNPLYSNLVHFIIVDMDKKHRIIPYDNEEFSESDQFIIQYAVVIK